MWSSMSRPGCFGLLRSLSFNSGKLTKPKCPLRTTRLFSVSASPNCPINDAPVRQWALEVNPFSTVRAQLGCSISVHPLDPHTFPEADRAFVTVHGAETEQQLGPEHFMVSYDEQSKELLISAKEVSSSVSVDLAAPIKSNLFITTRGKGSVQVKKMECDFCRVQTEEGNCLLHSVKGHQIEVKSEGGHVTGVGTIHGNVDISTRGYSTVDVKKLQGTRMNVSTEHGTLKVKAIYAESSQVSCSSGRIQLGHIHGKATVENISGDTVIDGSNDFLKISSKGGDVDVYIGDGGSADVQTQEGHVCVRVPSSLKAGVELCGGSVHIDPEVVLHRTQSEPAKNLTTVMGYLNGESEAVQWVRVRTDRGSVTLKTQSWFETLKLGGQE
ncbi:protein FAM185A [Takifugu flavidus]|uniref:protein FAM185A n=1 Tax=Takifugu flavidus TaxID=433684 RepID=UPI0025440C0F|nr:protein FAM185A [Takifugu flavidus]XP_056907661.1 protein FAM185A [Takifugu flavidus]